MALDKIIDSKALEAKLTSIANHIRAKLGKSNTEKLTFNYTSTAYEDAIDAIPTDSGGQIFFTVGTWDNGVINQVDMVDTNQSVLYSADIGNTQTAELRVTKDVYQIRFKNRYAGYVCYLTVRQE